MQDLELFLAWTKEQGCQVDCFSIQHSDMGLGVYARNTSSSLLSYTIALNKSKVLQIATHGTSSSALRLGRCFKSLEAAGITCTERVALMTMLLLGDLIKSDPPSKDSNDPGFWIPYFRLLPRSFATPLFYNELETRWLVGTGLEISRRSKLTKLQREYQSLLPSLSLLCGPTETLSFEQFKLADATFWSRVLSFRLAPDANLFVDDLHLVPFLDFFNHSFYPQVRWMLEPEGIRLIQDDGHERFESDQLFISYGSKPNTELLFIHGFVIPENPYDSISVTIPFVESQQEEISDEAYALMNAKSQFLTHVGLGPIIQLKMPSLQEPSIEGMLDSYLITMFVAVLIADDGLSYKNDTKELTLNGVVMSSSVLLQKTVQALPHYDVILLRIFAVLTDALFHRKHVLMESAADMDMQAYPEETWSDSILQAIGLLKAGHMDILEKSISILEEWTNDYANRPLVIEYLQGFL